MNGSIQNKPSPLRSPSTDDLRLAQDAETIVGLNGMPMLYIGTTGKYIRLSQLGASVVELLRGGVSRDALIQALRQQCAPNGSALHVEHDTNHFLMHLARIGAIAPSDFDASIGTKSSRLRDMLRRLKPQSTVRLALWRPDRPIGLSLMRSFGRLRWQCGDVARTLTGFAVLATLAFVAYSAMQAGRSFDLTQAVLPAAIAAFVLHLCLHEAAHVLACAHYGVKIREIGVGLLYYLIPMAYVDRTDSYRLAETKSQAHIAIAGPIFDLFGTCVTAVVMLVAEGSLRATAQVVLLLQAASFASNVNFLLPTDGYHVLEAVLGEVNLRQRALTFVTHRAFCRKLPTFLANLSRTAQTTYVIYGMAALAYLVLLIGFVSFFFFGLVMSVIPSLSGQIP